MELDFQQLKDTFGGEIIKITTYKHGGGGFRGGGKWVLTGDVYWELKDDQHNMTFSYCQPIHGGMKKKLFASSSRYDWLSFVIKNPTISVITKVMEDAIKICASWKASRGVFEDKHPLQMFHPGYEYKGSE
ncbi:hypothetical protein KAR91_66420 [Candidatus Pacearchaeota archaeon]|nr:hypothetical protein [Candidatus Pacearchaeota archaeon]